MSRMKLNNWFVKGNELSISLMSFYTKIEILKNDEAIYCQLLFKDSDEKEMTFNFYTVEDAVLFTEQVIHKSKNVDEVLEKYKAMFNPETSDNQYQDEKSDGKKDIIELTPSEVDQAIIEYFGSGRSYKLSIDRELSLCQNKIDLKYYLISHLNYDGVKKNIRIMLTEVDLKAALSHYVDSYDYDLVDFKYIGGIHKTGYFFDEDTPHYDGIQLKVKPKEHAKVLCKY